MMNQAKTPSMLVAGIAALAVGAAFGATTGSVSASILLGLAALLTVILVFNVVRGRLPPRDALLTAGTGVLPAVVFFACTGLALGGSASFDADSQFVGVLAGGGVLLPLLIIRLRFAAREDRRPKPNHPGA